MMANNTVPILLGVAAAGMIAALGLGAASPTAAHVSAEPGEDRTISGKVRAEDPALEAEAYQVTAFWADDAMLFPDKPVRPEPVTVLADPGSGDYVLEGLTPGTYYVEFDTVSDGADEDAPVLVTEYHGDTTFVGDAAPVNVWSESARSIDAELAVEHQDRVVLSDVSDVRGSSTFSEFYNEITWLANQGITRGWPGIGGTSEFRPFAHITRDAMATFLYRYAGSPEVVLPEESPFVDVTPESTEFYDEIVWLAQEGISEGWGRDGSKEFRPFEPITRDAMAAFLYRYMGPSDHLAISLSPFSDVAESHPFYREITWMWERGISTGWASSTGQQFGPSAPVTRDAMAAFIYRLYNLPKGCGCGE